MEQPEAICVIPNSRNRPDSCSSDPQATLKAHKINIADHHSVKVA